MESGGRTSAFQPDLLDALPCGTKIRKKTVASAVGFFFFEALAGIVAASELPADGRGVLLAVPPVLSAVP